MPADKNTPAIKYDVLTLFPDMFAPVLGASIIGRAVKKGVIDICLTNIRDFSRDKHKKADDYPYGGGHGLIMAAQPIYDAWRSVAGMAGGGDILSDGAGTDGPAGTAGSARAAANARPAAHTIYMSPQGARLTQKRARELSQKKHLIIICGHYEGVDERVLELAADEEISIGDYVLTGGEIPAMALIDCVSRMIPGVLSDEAESSGESHYSGLLEYPQYTRPASFMGMGVPQVLLDGNHAEIEQWRSEAAIERTRTKRNDIFAASLRRLQVGAVVNMRDLGGYPANNGPINNAPAYDDAAVNGSAHECLTAGGDNLSGGYPANGRYATRWQVFLRSDRLEGFTDRDFAYMREYGLKTVIDLRSKDEILRIPSPYTDVRGVDYRNIALLPEPVIDNAIMTAPFKELYILFAERGRKKIGKVFTVMAKSPGVCLFHCHAGKDRTGIIAALLLMLAGVPNEDVVADYETSGTYYLSKITGAAGDYHLSKAETILHFIKHIEKKYGGANEYLKSAGVTENDINSLLNKFITNPV